MLAGILFETATVVYGIAATLPAKDAVMPVVATILLVLNRVCLQQMLSCLQWLLPGLCRYVKRSGYMLLRLRQYLVHLKLLLACLQQQPCCFRLF